VNDIIVKEGIFDDTPTIVKGQDLPVELAEEKPETPDDRRSYIGGSDAAAAIGMSMWKDRYRLWEEKTGLVEPEDISTKDAVYWGTVLEAVVAQEYVRRTGNEVRRQPKLIRHPKYPWMGAHVDRVILNSKGILEVKTTGRESEEWGEEGSDEVPQAYHIQVSHYMAVTEREYVEIALLAGGQRFKLYRVARDEAYIRQIVELEAEFWEWVRTQTPPPPETSDEANRRWPVSTASEVQADPETIKAVRALAFYKALEKRAKDRQGPLELSIKAALGDRGDTLMAGLQKLATWKTQPANRFDMDNFKKDFPELVHAYTTEGKTNRVLRLTKQKEE
jgi:putative phage-type endonuclease